MIVAYGIFSAGNSYFDAMRYEIYAIYEEAVKIDRVVWFVPGTVDHLL